MAKISKSFRLSDQAQQNLRVLAEQSGASETAIVEMALSYFTKVMKLQEPVIPEPEFPEDGWLPGSPVRQPNPQPNNQNHKKKKR